MKKAIIVSTVGGFVPRFELENVRILQELGYEVSYASNFKTPVYEIDQDIFSQNDIKTYQVDFVRSPFSLKNIKVFLQLKRIMKENKFELIHCHTPMGGLIGRLVAKCSKVRRIIYTAHGLHFYKGAPIINWILYYPIEYLMSYITDDFITINNEDFMRVKGKFKCKRVFKIPGPGINLERFKIVNSSCAELRSKLCIPKEAFVLTTVGELNKNKNQKVVIEALHILNNKDIYYLICGNGEEFSYLEKLSNKYGLTDNIKFLGYRNDIPDILNASDCYIISSFREGIATSALEAMASGLPVISSYCRGVTEYNINGFSGCLCSNNSKEYAKAISLIKHNEILRNEMSQNCMNIVKDYSSTVTRKMMYNIYSKL